MLPLPMPCQTRSPHITRQRGVLDAQESHCSDAMRLHVHVFMIFYQTCSRASNIRKPIPVRCSIQRPGIGRPVSMCQAPPEGEQPHQHL